jgi:hypothetical protein
MTYQGLVQQSDIGLAGDIIALGFQSFNTSGGTYNNVQISLCHTTVLTLSSDIIANYGGNTPQMVFTADSLSLSGDPDEWQSIIFTAPFSYNNTDSLLVEIRWSGGGGVFYTFTSDTPGVISCGTVTDYDGTALTALFEWHNRYRLSFYETDLVPASLGELRSLYH